MNFENFRCYICFNNFSSTRIPIQLPCLHIYCEKCIKENYITNNNSIFCLFHRNLININIEDLMIPYKLKDLFYVENA